MSEKEHKWKHGFLTAVGGIFILAIFCFIYFVVLCKITIYNNTGKDIREIKITGKSCNASYYNITDKSNISFRRNIGDSFEFKIEIHFADGTMFEPHCRGNGTKNYSNIEMRLVKNRIKISTKMSKLKSIWSYFR